MSVWNEIIIDKDLTDFLELYDGFHDCCLKELRYISGAFVGKDLSMNPVNTKRKLSILFQRQSEDKPVVELEFSCLESLNLKPVNQTSTCEILDVSMFFENEKLYWSDSDLFKTQRKQYEGTWLCAKKARWRFVDEYLGDKEIY